MQHVPTVALRRKSHSNLAATVRYIAETVLLSIETRIEAAEQAAVLASGMMLLVQTVAMRPKSHSNQLATVRYIAETVLLNTRVSNPRVG